MHLGTDHGLYDTFIKDHRDRQQKMNSSRMNSSYTSAFLSFINSSESSAKKAGPVSTDQLSIQNESVGEPCKLCSKVGNILKKFT